MVSFCQIPAARIDRPARRIGNCLSRASRGRSAMYVRRINSRMGKTCPMPTINVNEIGRRNTFLFCRRAGRPFQLTRVTQTHRLSPRTRSPVKRKYASGVMRPKADKKRISPKPVYKLDVVKSIGIRGIFQNKTPRARYTMNPWVIINAMAPIAAASWKNQFGKSKSRYAKGRKTTAATVSRDIQEQRRFRKRR